MEFTVKFASQEIKFVSQRGYAVSMPTRKVGLRQLDEARAMLGSHITCVLAPQLLEDDVSVNLTEEQARASGLFDEANEVTVEVPKRALNKYVALTYQEGIAVRATYTIDKKQVLADWIAAGYPEQWSL